MAMLNNQMVTKFDIFNGSLFLLLVLLPFLSLFDTPKKPNHLSLTQLLSPATIHLPLFNSHAHFSLCLPCRPAAGCPGVAGGRWFSLGSAWLVLKICGNHPQICPKWVV